MKYESGVPQSLFMHASAMLFHIIHIIPHHLFFFQKNM